MLGSPKYFSKFDEPLLLATLKFSSLCLLLNSNYKILLIFQNFHIGLNSFHISLIFLSSSLLSFLLLRQTECNHLQKRGKSLGLFY
ncbi:hypothetical protein F383_34666 [Gossypium arboreum]|uniref:Uncharacterized protein n=1 Tax=Gossypium arboreum TaxID=29729 RepID=A0A0B0MZE6_GOSAR|nr:hypothetical protein F383_34666 [Gossypium arboreum]